MIRLCKHLGPPALLCALAAALLRASPATAARADAPSHGRPFFMPASERSRLQRLVRSEPWAAAAELVFPGSGWSLAFEFDPPQPVTYNGTELSFPLGSLAGDRWSVGFCRPGELGAWRQWVRGGAER